MKERLDRAEYELTFRPPLAILSFVDNTLPQQKRIDARSAVEYSVLAELPLLALTIDVPQLNERLYVGITRPVSGVDITHLAHFGAPNKIFGADTGDYISDEHTLFNPHGLHGEERLHNHRLIPNWDVFERIRERLTHTIKTDWENPEANNFKLTPIIQVRNKHGALSVGLEMHKYVKRYLEEVIFDAESVDLQGYMPELGPLLLAAYSPDITQKWPEDDTYHASCATKQRIAATQMVPYSLAHANDLLLGRFAANFVNYCETGQLLPTMPDATQIVDIQTTVGNPQIPFPDEPYFGNDEVIW